MKKLIDELIRDGYLKTPQVIEAFQKIDRADFLPRDGKSAGQLRIESEINAPLPTAYGQTISQPLTVAFMLELLQPTVGERVLDIGSGSGWTACLLAALVGETGQVTSLERIPELKKFAEENSAPYAFPNITYLVADGWRGYAPNAPYDVIHVAAAVTEIPEALMQQLQPGGRLCLPVGSVGQDLVLISKKSDGQITEKRYPGFVFVPLRRDEPEEN
ncbi:MAG: protein-L-isoaspartate O-methyltransferase [Patescibacteria group bacterium]